ncbi:helix-turn-helix domain-containing protein [Agrobacterium vitis]
MTVCPCCSAALPADDVVRVDLDGGFIVANAAVARLTETEFNLFLTLWGAKPRIVSKEQLMAKAYWLRTDEEEPEIKIIDVLVCKIRKKLTPLGVTIDTIWGRGYRIIASGRVPE